MDGLDLLIIGAINPLRDMRELVIHLNLPACGEFAVAVRLRHG